MAPVAPVGGLVLPFIQRLAQAKWAVLCTDPFLGYLVSELPTFVVADPHPVETAQTDFRSFTYNENFCGTMSRRELTFVVIHEALHVLLAHGSRRGNREMDLFNVACDHVINLMIQDNFCTGSKTIAQMPTRLRDGKPVPIGYADPEFRGLTVEQVYDRLVQDTNTLKLVRNADGTLSLHGLTEEQSRRFRSFDPRTGDNLTEQDHKEIKAAVQAAVGRALIRAASQRHRRQQGTEPSAFERLAQAGFVPQTPWHHYLRAKLVAMGTDDVDWSRPHKKYLGLRMGGKPVFLPRRTGVSFGTIVACVDTSGSIVTPELSQFLAELNSLLGRGEVKLRLFSCDAAVHDLGVFSHSRRIPDTLGFLGGGGTDFRPAFEAATAIHKRTAITSFIYFTDTAGTFPTSAPPYPTLWLVPQAHVATVPFGTIIPLNLQAA